MNEIIENRKPVVGYEDFYEVSDLGRVRALFDNWNGRYKAGRIISPIVRPESLMCRHLDGTRTNNAITNIKWGTRVENTQDSIRHRTFVEGEKNNLSKLTAEKVLIIRSMFDAGDLCKTIATQFGISIPQAWRIGARKSWSRLARPC